MSTAPATSSRDIKAHDALRTNNVDLVSSLLTSLIVFIGMAVTLLFILYLTKTMTWEPERLVLEEEKVAGRGENAAGFARDLEPPGEEEIEDLTEPSLEQTLEAMTEALSSISASLDSLDASLESSSGAGQGDSRPPGPLGEGDDIIPRFERWELKFSARSRPQYARQLDFYGIELAAIGGSPTVDYLSKFSGSPATRSGTSKEEKRLNFTWREEGTLKQYEKQMLDAAGIKTEGRFYYKFISAELEEELAQAEMRYAIAQKGKQIPVKTLLKTVFESTPTSTGSYEWKVIDQRYRLQDQMGL
jgi:hypothetical protein